MEEEEAGADLDVRPLLAALFAEAEVRGYGCWDLTWIAAPGREEQASKFIRERGDWLLGIRPRQE